MHHHIKTIGLISDTHGLLRNSLKEALYGVDLIIHAGDIDTPAVLEELEKIAPVTAIRGNMDVANRVNALPETDLIDVGGIFIYVIHDLQKLDLDPAAAGISVVIFGHSHRPVIEQKHGILYVNPGSAGPKRFNLPIAAGFLEIGNGRITPNIIKLSNP